MITVIIGSNRSGSATGVFGRYIYQNLRDSTAEEVKLFDLAELPGDLISPQMYSQRQQSEELVAIQDSYFIPAGKFWFVVPEYNGSFPGSLKVLIDAMSIRALKETFYGKKACLTGVASGRAGNLRGMDHLCDVLNHLEVIVLPLKLPISEINKLLDPDKRITDPETLQVIAEQRDKFLKF